jgi:NAD(P)-dependent dehydrogenase (short-subunit alcohol dehydrogenase family)
MMPANYPFSVDGNEFQGKRVLVTGGTKGMGEAIVRRMTLGGGSVGATARSPLPEAQQPAHIHWSLYNRSLFYSL